MSHFGLKINKSESPDKTPYTVYYPHTIPSNERKWTQPYYQVVSIDPATKNYALRIERRYHNGWITPVVFDKVSIGSIVQEGDTTICNTYQVLTQFLSKYEQFYDECHFIIIERQLPQNYKATRIAQHSITYFSMRLHNRPLLPSIVEVDPQLKGKALGAPKGINPQQLKSWAVEKARELLTIRKDDFSLQVLDYFRNKQDDLSDTVCQAEAIFICWGLLPTIPPPSTGPDNTPQDPNQVRSLTLSLIPTMIIPNLDSIAALIKPINNLHIGTLIQAPIPAVNLNLDKGVNANTAGTKIMSLIQTVPIRNNIPIVQTRLQATPITLNINKPLTLSMI